MQLGCMVCGRKVDVNKSLLTEHKNKHGKLCYGSFMPMTEINIFKTPTKSRLLEAMGQDGDLAPSYYGAEEVDVVEEEPFDP